MGREQTPGNEDHAAFRARPAEPLAVAAPNPNEVTVFQAPTPAAEISPPLVDRFRPNRRQKELLARLAPGDSVAPGELAKEWTVKRTSGIIFHIKPLVKRGLLEPIGNQLQRRYQRTDLPLPGRPLTQEELAAEHAARERYNEYERKRFETGKVKENQHRANKKSLERKLRDPAFPFNKRQVEIREELGIGASITTQKYAERFKISPSNAYRDLRGMVNRGLLSPVGTGNKITYLCIDLSRPAAENGVFVVQHAAELKRKPKSEWERIMELREALVRNAYDNGYAGGLTPTQDMVLTARYRTAGPLPSHSQLRQTLTQAFGKEHISRQRVQQIEAHGLKKLAIIRDRQLSAVSIEALSISRTAKKALQAAGVTDVGGIIKMSDQDLLAIRGFGTTSLWEVRNAVAAVKNILPHPDYEPLT